MITEKAASKIFPNCKKNNINSWTNPQNQWKHTPENPYVKKHRKHQEIFNPAINSTAALAVFKSSAVPKVIHQNPNYPRKTKKSLKNENPQKNPNLENTKSFEKRLNVWGQTYLLRHPSRFWSFNKPKKSTEHTLLHKIYSSSQTNSRKE